jgi:hypothetical protein
MLVEIWKSKFPEAARALARVLHEYLSFIFHAERIKEQFAATC